MEIQLDLFDKTEVEKLKTEMEQKIDNVKQRGDNARRGLFARHNEIVKTNQDIVQMLQAMQSEILWIKRLVEEKHESEIIQLNAKVM